MTTTDTPPAGSAGWYRYDDTRAAVYVDISLNGYREVFNEWDFSPAINRDLDDDLFEYLDACVMDLPDRPHLCLAFHLPLAVANEEQEHGCTIGLRNYYRYQIRLENKRMHRTWRNAMYYALFGLAFLFCGSELSQYTGEDTSFLVEGFFIGGWVLFWELFTIIFFQLREHWDILRRRRRLLNAHISYVYSDSPDVTAGQARVS